MSGRFRYDGEVGTLQKRYLVVHDFDASVRSHNQISNRLSDHSITIDGRCESLSKPPFHAGGDGAEMICHELMWHWIYSY